MHQIKFRKRFVHSHGVFLKFLIFSEPVYSLLLFNKFVKYNFTDLEKEAIK